MSFPGVVPPAAISKKKQALMPSTPLRRRLRAHGHGLDPLVRIGKDGITPGLVRQLTQILFDHEICKVKLEAECPVDRFVAADGLREQPGVNIVQVLGRTILVYKRHPQKPRFEGAAATGEPATPGPAPSGSATPARPRRSPKREGKAGKAGKAGKRPRRTGTARASSSRPTRS